MFIEPVGHLLQADTDVLLANLLANDEKGDRGILAVEVSHETRENGPITHTCVKYPQSRWHGFETPDVQGDALGDYLLLTAGAHKEEVFLAVVVKTGNGARSYRTFWTLPRLGH